MVIKEIKNKNKKEIVNFLIESWGSPVIVSRGQVHDVRDLSGFVAYDNNQLIGLITYKITYDQCEIVTLDSLSEGIGIGSKLVFNVVEKAKELKCSRIWLITTNDNIEAIRFYQKRGFTMSNLYLNAVVESRKLKPEIPLVGYHNIPIEHEIEFEMYLYA